MRIQDSLDQTSLDIEKNTGLGNVYTQEAALLSANKSVGGANSGVDPDNLKEVADIFRERMIDLTIKLIDIHKEEKRLAEKFKKLNAQLIELKSKDNKPTSNILITLSAKARTNVNFTVSYYVSGASWTPKYDIRATDIQSPVQLFYKADITQNTGEDWKDVKLILSTGNPSLGGNKPVLLPWYLDFYNSGSQWQKPMNLTNQAPAVMELQSVEIRSGKQEETDLQYNTVSVEQNQLSTDFEIQIPYSVPSDSKQYTVDIQSHELPASFTYYAAPKIDKDAFLMARITGWENLNLLAGKTNVYFEGSFVGESSVDPRSANDTLDLSLGRDKTIIILREKQKDLNSSKFVGGNIVKELNYEITVRNGKKQPIQITLEDQVPVTRNSDIKINVQEYSSGNYSEDNGKITWKLNIAPAGVEKRKLNFTVKYPKDKVISGL
ncbi:MAG TPA: DUF4139 domain-containing protein [Bacteroidia bacterium]|nr:DUF4139 domain-containing protein [Bacteroidia bacterium]